MKIGIKYKNEKQNTLLVVGLLQNLRELRMLKHSYAQSEYEEKEGE